MLAPAISGAGTVTAQTGTTTGCDGGLGRVRIEAFSNTFTGSISGVSTIATLSPNTIFLPTGDAASVRVIAVNAVAVPGVPEGDFLSPDVTIDAAGSVVLDIESIGIPAGTVVTLHVFPESGPDQTVLSTALSGASDPLTATAGVTFPNGFTKFTVRAVWTP